MTANFSFVLAGICILVFGILSDYTLLGFGLALLFFVLAEVAVGYVVWAAPKDGLKAFRNVFKGLVYKVQGKTPGSEFTRLYR